MKLVSWNVNGLRAVLRRNFLEFLDSEKPDVLCLQEIKCHPDDIEQLWPFDYTTYWNPGVVKNPWTDMATVASPSLKVNVPRETQLPPFTDWSTVTWVFPEAWETT